MLAGAAVLAGLTLAGVSAPGLLLALGATAVVAWLVDGTSTRYLGPGLVAVAVGAGILLGNTLDMDPRKAEHSLVYGGFGLALLAISRGDGIPQPPLDRSGSGGERRVQAARTPTGSRT